ncbi:MAG: hypothetical protein RJA76_568 [Bacteroidota bacterium]|jgi:cbb3-type cytochrome oxidase maturation protein
MEIIYILISISFLLALSFLAAFIWSVKSGQQNDLVTPAMRILMEDSKPISEKINFKYESRNDTIRKV